MSSRSECFALDSNCLISMLMVSHPNQEATLRELDHRLDRREKPIISANAIAEAFSVTTRFPAPDRVPVLAASEAIAKFCRTIKVVPIDAEVIELAIERVREAHGRGGAIYDAIIAVSSWKAGATTLLTWNVGHMMRYAPPGMRIVQPE